MKVTLGEAIKTERKKLHMSIETLAKKVGKHRTHISRIEHSLYLPSLELMEKIAKELNAAALVKLYFIEKRKNLSKTEAATIKKLKVSQSADFLPI